MQVVRLLLNICLGRVKAYQIFIYLHIERFPTFQLIVLRVLQVAINGKGPIVSLHSQQFTLMLNEE